jgi:hypothetical protein
MTTVATMCERVAGFIDQPAPPFGGAAARGQAPVIDGGAGDFDRLALELFAFQFETIAPYQRLCRGLGKTPSTVADWRAIPAVPALAFKHHALFAGDPATIARTFRSSGTTEPGRTSQSAFSRAGLEVMDTAVAAAARQRLFPDGRATRMLVLTPPPEAVPHMIMVHGMAHLMRSYGLPGSRFAAGPRGVDFAELWTELVQCQRDGVPVSLLGSSFGFVHLFDWMESAGRRLELPAGSRVMDAGGYKGKSREISRETFVGWAAQICGIRRDSVINLLGMTELASQIYDRVAPATPLHGAIRMKQPPPWVRTEVVDPRRSEPVGDGELGLLRHLDLANIERPLAIQTEDVGRRVATTAGGFEILGRAQGAEPRGCSLTADDVTTASDARTAAGGRS